MHAGAAISAKLEGAHVLVLEKAPEDEKGGFLFTAGVLLAHTFSRWCRLSIFPPTNAHRSTCRRMTGSFLRTAMKVTRQQADVIRYLDRWVAPDDGLR